MAETFLVLFTAHLAGDFLLQTRRMLAHKKNPAVLLLHVALVTLASAALLGGWHGPILIIIFVTHLLMDAIKVYWLPKTTAVFLLDQAVHVLVIAGLAAVFTDAFSHGAWVGAVGDAQPVLFLQSVTLAAGLIMGVPVGGVLIGMTARTLVAQLSDKADLVHGLENGGLYIGWLERALVMLFYGIGEPSGIGFLLAAKSILRFGEIRDSSQRRLAEYIIIGTLMSFGWALLMAVLTEKAMDLW